MKQKASHTNAGVKASRIVLAAMLFAALAMQGTSRSWAQPAVSQEYRVKAAFLYNFAKFVKWPPETFENTDAPLVLCVLGDDPFGSALDMLQGKSVRGRRLAIYRTHAIDGPPSCQLLYVAGSERARLQSILDQVRGRPVLTVSDLPDFTLHGGIIGFFTVQSRIRFAINPGAAVANGLKISSQLLKLARIRRQN